MEKHDDVLEAERRIRKAIKTGEDRLSLSYLTGVTSLSDLDLDIADATSLETLDLDGTQITDLSPIAGMNGITELDLRNTKITDLSPIAGLNAITELHLDKTQVTDLSPIAGLNAITELYLDHTKVTDFSPLSGLQALKELFLENTAFSDLHILPTAAKFQDLDLKGSKVTDLRPLRDLTFEGDFSEFTLRVTDTPAARSDPKIAEIDAMEDHNERVKALLAYVATLPPIDDALAKNNADPITVTAVLEAQDQTGWRFSPTHGALELFILDNGDTAKQQKMAEIVKQRLRNLLDKLSNGNHYGIRLDTLTEANLFNDLLNDDESTYSANALALWASLIALGGQLEANDAGQAAGRDPFDLLKPDDRSALQTFLAVASGFVRSFEDTKDLDDSVVAFGRTALPIELLSDVLGKAVEQALISTGSANLIKDVAKLAANEGTQGNKAHAVTATGSKNLVMTAALVGSVATGSGLVAGATGKVGSDLVDHYEVSDKAIQFLSSIDGELDQLLKGLAPDERANLVSILKDFEATRLAK